MSSKSTEALAHPAPSHRPEAWHRTGAGGLMRNLVLGSSDGLVGFLAFVAGVSASLPSKRSILLAGFAEMRAGSISMGLGAYLGAKSERECYERELSRERREIREMPLEEREEIRLALTAIVLFSVGAAKSRITQSAWWKSGAEMAGFGLAGALLCHFVSAGIASL